MGYYIRGCRADKLMPSELIILTVQASSEADANLGKLAAFLGLPFRVLPLPPGALRARLRPDEVGTSDACLAVTAGALSVLAGRDGLEAAESAHWFAGVNTLFVHAARPSDDAAAALSALTGQTFVAATPGLDAEARYQVDVGRGDVACDYAGLSFGHVRREKDFGFVVGRALPRGSAIVSVSGRPFLAELRRHGCRMFLLAADGLVDLDSRINRHRIEQTFGGLVAPAMVLRHIFGAQCWRGTRRSAAFIIDDPMLTPKYGFLDYERLHTVVGQIPFSLSVAFIPYNYYRSHRRTVRLFAANPERYTVCFHGNDHTWGEFGRRDVPALNGAVRQALERMSTHESLTGLRTDPVMVMPQEIWSAEAMHVLKANHFLAAISAKAVPADSTDDQVVADLLEPALTRYSAFPLFMRKYAGDLSPDVVAFWSFFGKPILLAEHHGFLRDGPERLMSVAALVNGLGVKAPWSGLAEIARTTSLIRCAADGRTHVRIYAREAILHNPTDEPVVFHVEKREDSGVLPKSVLLNDLEAARVDSYGPFLRLPVQVAPLSTCRLEVTYHNDLPVRAPSRALSGRATVFARRRLSEFRDRYVARYQPLLAFTQAGLRRWRELGL